MIWLTQYCLKSKLSIILNLCIYLFIVIIYIYKFKLFIIKQKGKWQYLNIWSPTLKCHLTTITALHYYFETDKQTVSGLMLNKIFIKEVILFMYNKICSNSCF